MKKTLLFLGMLFYSFSYGQNFDGNLGSNSLKWNDNQKDFNSPPRVGVEPMSVRLWDNYGGTNAPSMYGSLLEIGGKVDHLVSQLYFDNTWNGGRILYRSAFYQQETWESWRYLLDSKSDIESSGNLKISGSGNHFILNGNVGIGNNNPNSRLDLGKGYGVNGAKLLVYNDDNTSELSGTKCGFYMDNFTSNNLNLVFPEAVAYSGLFTISGKNTSGTTLNPYFSVAGLTGNVGIGTTKPDSKLTVKGNIHAQEVKVTVNAGNVPDYVFANDYKLRSLQEVEKYIKENNHLPEIPSAQEIEKNGLMLAEMNMNLLKKIEEMTLYMIEQEKKNNKQSLQLELLEKENLVFKTVLERLSKIEEKLK